MHKKTYILSIRTQKIKDIKEQMQNKVIKLENNKFKDFVCTKVMLLRGKTVFLSKTGTEREK